MSAQLGDVYDLCLGGRDYDFDERMLVGASVGLELSYTTTLRADDLAVLVTGPLVII